MKIRDGFVSNSSSSSFIIGATKVNDVAEAQKFLDSLKLGHYDARIVKVSNLDKVYDAQLKGDDVVVESFMYTEVRAKGVTPDDYVLVMYHTDGDDSDFWNDWEYDYDIDLDFFSDAAQKLYDAINCGTNGLDRGEVSYGAGRDG